MINHVMAGDAVSAASKHYGQVKVYAASHEITALDRAGYANDSSLLDARNPMVAKDLGDSHRIHNFLPLDAQRQTGPLSVGRPSNAAAGPATCADDRQVSRRC